MTLDRYADAGAHAYGKYQCVLLADDRRIAVVLEIGLSSPLAVVLRPVVVFDPDAYGLLALVADLGHAVESWHGTVDANICPEPDRRKSSS